jgi:MFS family permease
MNGRAKLFYGWWVVAACALGCFLSPGTIVVLSFGVFIKPLVQDFHAGRAAISLAFTIHNLIGAACHPLNGRFVDRIGPRKVILTGTVMFGIVLLSSGLIGARIAYLYLLFAALGFTNGIVSPVPYGAVISRWFDRRRGLALGLTLLGVGLGAIVLPLVAHRLIITGGWRTAYAALGGAVLLLTLPVLASVLRDDPKEKGLLPDGAPAADRSEPGNGRLDGLSWHEIWHQPAFWLLICVFFLAGASVHACVLHMAALLSDRGITAQGAALGTSVVGLSILIGRVATGYLLDRFFAPRLATLLFGCASIGIAMLWVGSVGKIAVFAAFLVGLGMGAEVDLIAYCMSRYFGLKSFGVAYGFGFSAFVLAGALGTLLMGAGFDATHSYTLPLGIFFFSMAAAAAMMTRLGPYRYAPPESKNQRQPESVHAETPA